MGSANKHQQKTKNPTTSSETEDQNLTSNPNNLNLMDSESSKPPFTIDGAEEDLILSKSKFLTRKEVIRRRYRRLKVLVKVYEDYYWALMEDYRIKHREYQWIYGKTPFEEPEVEKPKDEDGNLIEDKNVGGGGDGKLGLGISENVGVWKIKVCAFSGCKTKAMEFTDYCHSHILSDTKQKLYKGCGYIIKSQHTGPVHCSKPILRATVPSLCSEHFGKAEKHVTRALKKAGLNISSPSKIAPKFHLIVAESVRQINTKRRERRNNVVNHLVKEETPNAGNDAKMEEAGG